MVFSLQDKKGDNHALTWYKKNMSSKLSSSQQKVFDYLVRFLAENGYPPSYSEIASQFGFKSDGTVRTYLDHLEAKGFISRAGHARGIRLLKVPEADSIPIVGRIAAGEPILATENIIGTLADLQPLSPKDGRFALTISGDSMKDAGILNGDIAIIQRGSDVRNGQIAAVMISSHATLKRVYFEKDRIRLQPENEDYSPTYISRSEYDAQILGRFIALVRQV